MTITITPAALHAALGELRKLGAERENDGEAAAFFIDGLNVLEALFDPAHMAPAEKGAAAPAEHEAPSATTVAARCQVSEAGTPAPPTIDLPAEPGTGALTPGATSAAAGAPAPEAPPPAQAAAGHPSPKARHAPPVDPPKGRPARITLTAEQEAKLRELWPHRGVRAADIRSQVNALGDAQITNDGTLYSVAHRLGLRLRTELWADQDSTAATATAAETDGAPPADASAPAAGEDDVTDHAPEPALQPEQPAPPRAPPPRGNSQFRGASLPAVPDDKADAFQAFDAGQSVRDVHADTGLPLSTLSNWQAEWKLASRKGNAA
jgi:hypothetical protein